MYVSSGPALIRSQNVLDNSLQLNGVARITEEAARQLAGVTVLPGDVLINITGDSIARVARVNSSVGAARVNQHVAIIRPTHELDGGFLQRVLVSPAMKDHLLALSQGGATRKALTKQQLQELTIPLPDLATQTAIADVLGALDDKIAANERVLGATLALARLQFADGSRKAESEWLTYDEVVDVQGGGTPRTGMPEYWGGPIRWATPTDVTALTSPVLFETSRTITEAGLTACSSQLHEPGSILMTSRATIGAFAWAFCPVAVNQGFIVAKAKNPMAQLWLFFEMQSRVDDYLAHANGATFLELSRSTFKRLPVAWPSDTSSFDRFNRAAQPLLELTAALAQENQRLAATRDALLPELMSGRLTVGEVA